MAYERHIWQCGEPVTDGKLNNIESGIVEALECCGSGGGALVLKTVRTEEVPPSCTYYYTGHTVREICDALKAGIPVIYVEEAPDNGVDCYYVCSVALVRQGDADYEAYEIGTYRIVCKSAFYAINHVSDSSVYLYAPSFDGELSKRDCIQ